jgi:hypothetical protein
LMTATSAGGVHVSDRVHACRSGHLHASDSEPLLEVGDAQTIWSVMPCPRWPTARASQDRPMLNRADLLRACEGGGRLSSVKVKVEVSGWQFGTCTGTHHAFSRQTTWRHAQEWSARRTVAPPAKLATTPLGDIAVSHSENACCMGHRVHTRTHHALPHSNALAQRMTCVMG